MKKIVAVSVCGLLLIGLVTGGCGARTEVAKEKALEKIDSLLGSMDVKRKEIELSVKAIQDSLTGLQKAKIKAKVQSDQLARKVEPIEVKVTTIDGTLRKLREHLQSGTSVEFAGRSYRPQELQAMANQVIAERKGIAEQLHGLQDAQSRLETVVGSLERKQADYDLKLSAIEGQIAAIDANRIALTAMKNAAQLLDGSDASLADSVAKLEEKVNHLYADVQTELIFEDATWDETRVAEQLDSVDTFIAAAQQPVDTITMIDKLLNGE